MRDHGVTEEQVKWLLYNAIVCQSSRLVISSMNPKLMAIHHMEFREYTVPKAFCDLAFFLEI